MELQQRLLDNIEFTITSVNPSPYSLEITASGPAGRYGNAFCSYVSRLTEIVGSAMAANVVFLTKVQ